MNILDIIGPVMVGPSSSHTAGAVRIGLVAGKLLAEPIKEAQIHLHGSFWATGSGHGTDRAIVAGLLGLAVDDARIPHSFELADEAGMKFSFDHVELVDAHPNTVKLNLTGVNGSVLEVVAASIGGGRIRVCEIDGLPANFEGDYPTLNWPGSRKAFGRTDQRGTDSSAWFLLGDWKRPWYRSGNCCRTFGTCSR